MARKFRRSGPVILLRLNKAEETFLESLVDQLVGLLADEVGPTQGDPASDDPFDRWQAELSTEDALDHTDPVILRLFPDAYPDDAEASAEFRRLTQARQRNDRVEQAEVVLAALRDSDGGRHPVQVRVIELDLWLKTLTAVRLALAARLEIQTATDTEVMSELPPEDPRAFLYGLYEWLAYLTEELIRLGG